jgi:hypothetical protein
MLLQVSFVFYVRGIFMKSMLFAFDIIFNRIIRNFASNAVRAVLSVADT